MTYDPAKDRIDAKTGFALDRRTGQPIGMLPLAIRKAKDDGSPYPKWVPVHSSHLLHGVKVNGVERAGLSVVDFTQFHLDRVTKVMSVTVNDEAEEERAASDLHADKPKEET